MIRLFQPLLILLSALLATVKAEKTNYMINPVYINGKSPVWTLGDQKVVAWKTDLPVFNVSIWQQSLLGGGAYTRGNVYAQVHEKDHVSNFTWTVQLYGFDLDYSPTFFFWINPGPGGFPSAYFNITERSSTAKTTPSIPVNSTLASSFPSSDTTVSPTDQPPALTTTAKLALGLGVGIGVPILVAMATLV
ncbi:hypothetical protein DTO006G1_2244 [Penicillium roqueforti]|uniref:uncharacterized protein n=1 Tax=Penicillium roqueforti TaxID=5082 RepID=UPI00190D2A64|nr:uncharacterized protein LCP9604111_6807 [Penicillium roqueforti]KAF9245489.1 hypothetical protein LCP9604111_6807 [Penicillium roqueforti]KAI1832891.1 hypothetical protein CBS147337_6302 [Penicillium roqueforti]KAI2672023.1 hypothetical protein LCP963914a_9486 [Penicillium roqueforti]KAI2697083.1 hypothetical protein CBS147372_8137 [Penicillium roqueforti]KAI2723882.1 hypothetical protein CBS147318_813 [Penicillium roqueforti]